MAEEGYAHPTPVQRQAIPVVLAGGDVLVGAQTGTGKTASFALPVMQLLAAKRAPQRRIRALVLVPTRELAVQVQESFGAYGRHLPLKSAVVFGGVNINPQVRTLRNGVDILVATPGRLLDHMRGRHADLGSVEILVLDEADRMLDMGFIHDIRRILAALPGKRQNLFFSATFSGEIRRLADSFLRSPAEVAVAREKATAELIRQVIHPVDKARKRALLSYLIGSGDWRQVLVFTRTKHGANRLAEQLQKDAIRAAAIHGNKSQGARTRALTHFKSGELRVLVATDIAARGLDIEQLPHVVNFELPNVPEDYVHRIGRTGRAGSAGVAVSLVCGEEQGFVREIERAIGIRIERVPVAGFEPGSAQPDGEKHADESQPPRPPPGGDSRREGARSHRGSASTKGRRQARSNAGAHGARGGSRRKTDERGARAEHRPEALASDATGHARKPAGGSLQNALRAVATLFSGSARGR